MPINKLKTLENLSINVDNLRPSSCKNVYWHCSVCKIEKLKAYRIAKINENCITCSNKINAIKTASKRSQSMKNWYKENAHPLLGIKRPKHVIEALRKANTGRIKSQEEREYRSKLHSGENNPFYGKKHSQETKKKISENNLLKSRKGKECNLYGRIYHPKRLNNKYTNKDKEIIYFRSSWELKVAKYLDENNISWQYECIKFDLNIDNKDCSYTPDFYITDYDYFIEVKGYWRENAIKKFSKTLETYNVKIEIWDKNKLKELNIL